MKRLPVSAADGGEVVSCYEAFIALPPARGGQWALGHEESRAVGLASPTSPPWARVACPSLGLLIQGIGEGAGAQV